MNYDCTISPALSEEIKLLTKIMGLQDEYNEQSWWRYGELVAADSLQTRM